MNQKFVDVKLANADIINAADIKVYDKVTGEEILNPDLTIETNGYKAENGVHDITVKYEYDSVVAKFSVNNGNFLEIKANEYNETSIGSSINWDELLTVSDPEDRKVNIVNIDDSLVDTNTLGVYPVVISATDNDWNISKKNMTIAVTDENTVISSDYVFYAVDYTQRVGEYTLSIGTGAETNDFKVSVVSGEKPKLTLENKIIETSKGEKVSLGDYIDYSDLEDNKEDLKLEIDSNLNVDRVGVYTINYKITDSDSNVSTNTLNIFVNDGNYVSNGSYALTANNVDYDLRTSEDLEQTIFEKANITAYKLNQEEKLQLDEVHVDLNKVAYKPGTYPVTLTVGNLSYEISVTITNGNVPTLIGPSKISINENSDVDYTTVKAYDFEDGDITDKITSTTEKSKEEIKVIYNVCDNDGNCASFTQIINIIPNAEIEEETKEEETKEEETKEEETKEEETKEEVKEEETKEEVKEEEILDEASVEKETNIKDPKVSYNIEGKLQLAEDNYDMPREDVEYDVVNSNTDVVLSETGIKLQLNIILAISSSLLTLILIKKKKLYNK